MKQLNCKDLGHNCDKVLTARTEDLLVDLAAMHLRDEHSVSAITPDIVSKVRNSIVNRTAFDAANVVDLIFEKYNCSGEPECTWRYIEEAEMILKGGTRVRRHELRAA
jgi:predicted small metal-binding protein